MRRFLLVSLLLSLAFGSALAQKVACTIVSGKVVHLVRPEYPESAKAAGIQGDVVLEAVVGKQGEIRKLRVVKSSSPLLKQAAVYAVQQWRYAPYRMNDKAIEVETTIRVHFVLPKKKANSSRPRKP